MATSTPTAHGPFPFWRVTAYTTSTPGLYSHSWPAIYSADAARDLLARLATGQDGRVFQQWEIERHDYAGQAAVEPIGGLPFWSTP